MKPIQRKYLKYLLIAIVCFLVFAFWPQRKEKEEGHPRDYAEIAADGILRAATEYNSISFFVDGDTVSGFHYELIEAFARDKGIQAQVFIRNQLDLAGRTLHVVKASPSILRIRNLGDEIGDTIYISEIEKYGSEQLIAMVAHGDIDYAVCDESIAQAAIDSLPQLDISTDISFTQFYSWGVSKQSPVLLDSLNTWLTSFRQGKEYKEILHKYYPVK